MPFEITFKGKEGQKGSFQSPDNKDVTISLKAGESVTTEKEPKELPEKFFTVTGGTIRRKKGEVPEKEKVKKEEEVELPINEMKEEEVEKPEEKVKSKKDFDKKKKKKKGDN